MTDDFFTHYRVTCNATGASWAEPITALDARFIRVPETLVTQGPGFTRDQAAALVASMNRAQVNHKNEVSYSIR